jgi:hypothetical protein
MAVFFDGKKWKRWRKKQDHARKILCVNRTEPHLGNSDLKKQTRIKKPKRQGTW